MRVLCVDIGTGTQDIFLYDSQVDIENGFKMVIPAPTMIVRKQLQQATRTGHSVLLTGVTMGGGPSHWAAEDHIRAGLKVFSTPQAAKSFNDDLKVVKDMGITIINPEDSDRLTGNIQRIEMKDFDFDAISEAMGVFGVSLSNLDAVAIAVFDHGAAPSDYSDRKFRFDYIRERISANNNLSTFAFRAEDLPRKMTRLRSVDKSASDVGAPLILMDTAAAAILGACQDRFVARQPKKIVANVGNFHTLAFQLDEAEIIGVFEHHTGLLNTSKLDLLLVELAAGTLSDEMVFVDNGHGAFIQSGYPHKFADVEHQFAVTGPRRKMMLGSSLNPYFATPFGDMMLAGCFGLLRAVADLVPALHDPIISSMEGLGGSGTPPWELLH